MNSKTRIVSVEVPADLPDDQVISKLKSVGFAAHASGGLGLSRDVPGDPVGRAGFMQGDEYRRQQLAARGIAE